MSRAQVLAVHQLILSLATDLLTITKVPAPRNQFFLPLSSPKTLATAVDGSGSSPAKRWDAAAVSAPILRVVLLLLFYFQMVAS